MIRRILGITDDSDSDDSEPEHDRPCNEAGHDWPEWERDPFSIKGDSLKGDSNTLGVYYTVNRNCNKCDKYDTKRVYVGRVRMDNDGTLEVTSNEQRHEPR